MDSGIRSASDAMVLRRVTSAVDTLEKVVRWYADRDLPMPNAISNELARLQSLFTSSESSWPTLEEIAGR